MIKRKGCRTKAAACFFVCKKVSNLKISFLTGFFRSKIHLKLLVFAYSNTIPSAKQLHINNILKHRDDIAEIVAVNCLAYSVIGEINLLLKPEHILPDKVLTGNKMNKAGAAAVFKIIVQRFV